MKVISLTLLLVIVPFLIGNLVVEIIRHKNVRGLEMILYGYLFMFSCFYITALPFVLWMHKKFTQLVIVYGVELLILSGLGIWMLVRKIRKKQITKNLFSIKKTKEKYDRISRIFFVLFIGMILFQIYQAVTLTSFDGDDAFYVAISNIANTQDEMYQISPYTGIAWGKDVSHAIAPFPLFLAFLARVSQTHAAYIAHVITPVFIIPLTYYVYFLVAEKLFYKKKEGISFFLCLISVLQIYGNVSIYTKETFFLTRTWQGKSIYANLIITMLFYLVYSLLERQHGKRKQKNIENTESVVRFKVVYEGKRDLWVLFFMTNCAACLMTSLSSAVSMTFLILSGVCMGCVYKNWKDFGKMMLCASPYVITLLVYFIAK